MANEEVAMIKPWEHTDALTERQLGIEVTPEYSKPRVDERVYYFIRETGEFDGTSGGIN